VAIPSPASKAKDGLSVFDVLNTFCARWFLNRDYLTANILSAQKDESRHFTWVNFSPPFHTHLVQRMHALLPPLCPMAKGKKVMFVFILEILDSEGPNQGSFWKMLKKHCTRSKLLKKAAVKPASPPSALHGSGAVTAPTISQVLVSKVTGSRDDVEMGDLSPKSANQAPAASAPPPPLPPPAKPYPLFPFPAFLSGFDHAQIVRWLRTARVKGLTPDAVQEEILRTGHIFDKAVCSLVNTYFMLSPHYSSR
jgi:hypothetical protein